jgi:hypothetical protein
VQFHTLESVQLSDVAMTLYPPDAGAAIPQFASHFPSNGATYLDRRRPYLIPTRPAVLLRALLGDTPLLPDVIRTPR